MQMSVAFWRLGLLLVPLLLCGCRSSRDAWTAADSWYRPPQDTSRFWLVDRLPDSDIVAVSEEKMAEAEMQLREASCVGVSEKRASELTGLKVESSPGKSLFLARGVCLNRGTGKFIVVPLAGELLVYHGSLGHSAVPMERQALVLRLPAKPDTVYVGCSMAE